MRVNRAWLGLALLMLPTFLVALDTTALLLALPRLSAALGADGVEQLWITDSYGFMVAGLVITMGRLGDRIGRRRLLLAGAAAFAVLSVVAAFAASPLMLIVVCALLGVAGATLAPSTLAPAVIFAGLVVLILTMRPATPINASGLAGAAVARLLSQYV
jgi:DHA2 family multidrug resistance protein-like MFS transporter